MKMAIPLLLPVHCFEHKSIAPSTCKTVGLDIVYANDQDSILASRFNRSSMLAILVLFILYIHEVWRTPRVSLHEIRPGRKVLKFVWYELVTSY